MQRQSYIPRMRNRWESVKASTPNQYASRPGLSGIAADQVSVAPVITAAVMEAANPKVKALYGDFGLSSSSSMTDFAKRIRVDADLMRATWPNTEKCMTVAALDRLITPVKMLAERVASTGNDMAGSGIRRLVADEYTRVATDLVREVSGKHGIGPVLYHLNQAKAKVASVGEDADAATICIERPALSSENPIRAAILFTLGRIAIALETYATLEDFRPWFTKNRVFEWVFEVFYRIGEVAIAIAEGAGQVITSLSDLAQFTAKSLQQLWELMKIATIAGGAFLVYWYVLRDKKKKGTR